MDATGTYPDIYVAPQDISSSADSADGFKQNETTTTSETSEVNTDTQEQEGDESPDTRTDE